LQHWIAIVPLAHNKDASEGVDERMVLLRAAGVPLFDPHATRSRLGRDAVAVDDIIDAAVMLLTARDITRSTASSLPKKWLFGRRSAADLRTQR